MAGRMAARRATRRLGFPVQRGAEVGEGDGIVAVAVAADAAAALVVGRLYCAIRMVW